METYKALPLENLYFSVRGTEKSKETGSSEGRMKSSQKRKRGKSWSLQNKMIGGSH